LRAGKAGIARAGEGKSRPRLHIPLLWEVARLEVAGNCARSVEREERREGKRRGGRQERAPRSRRHRLPSFIRRLPSPHRIRPPAALSQLRCVLSPLFLPLFALPVFLPPSVLPLLPLLCCVGSCLCYAHCSFFPLLLLLCSAGCLLFVAAMDAEVHL